jgi:hypothetical protein
VNVIPESHVDLLERPELGGHKRAPATYRVNRLATVLLERRLDWAGPAAVRLDRLQTDVQRHLGQQ